MSKVASSSVTVTTTATKLVDARPGRRDLLILNKDQIIRIGPSTVSSSDGYRLDVAGNVGDRISLAVTGEIWAIRTAGGGVDGVVDVLEVYDE